MTPVANHPPAPQHGFYRLAVMEMWERFSLHGMKALLTLYLIHDVLDARRAAPMGFDALRRGLESLWGPLTPLAMASQVYGLYAAMTYLAVPIGGLLGDRLIGRQPAVIAGALLIVGGHACLTQAWLLLPALALLIAGTGLLKANLAAQVGNLFAPDDPRRGTAFARYLAFINIGVMLGPLVCGWLAQRFGWEYAFATAGVAMLAGLAVYLAMPGIPGKYAADASDAPPGGVAPSLAVAFGAIAVTILGFSAYEQVSNLFLVWIERTVRLDVGGFVIPPAWFVAADGVLTIGMVVLTTRLAWFARLGHADRLIAGCAAIGVGHLLLALLAAWDVRAIVGPIGVLACLDLGIALLWPATLAIVTAAAPRGYIGALIGLFYLHGFVANLVVGAMGSFYERLPVPVFWLVHAGIAGCGVVGAWMLRTPCQRLPSTLTEYRQDSLQHPQHSNILMPPVT